MKVLVCGSRSWSRVDLIGERLGKLALKHDDVELIHGDAQGADELAASFGRALRFNVRAYPADWKRYGRSAGIIRNVEMLDEQPDLVLAFWDGDSTGTKHTIDEAENRGIPVEIIYEQGGNDWR